MFPKTRIKLFVFFILVGVYWIPAFIFIGIRIFWDLLLTGSGGAGNIATLAHIGGYVTGIAVGMVLLGFKIIPREPYDLFTIARQANRRRALRELSYQQERKTKRIREGRERPSGLDRKKSDALADARAEVTSKISTGDMEGAAEAYKALLAKYGAMPSGATLARKPQYELANHLFASGDYQTADIAYERLLEAYPNDTERGQIRVMLGRINARYLNDPVKAKEHLEIALEQLHDDATMEIARRELEDLG
jgi:tetratricopeptide (TPR) repeat protein